jgi:hypothetical protein
MGLVLRQRLDLRDVADVESVDHYLTLDAPQSVRLPWRAGGGVPSPSGSRLVPRSLPPEATARPKNHHRRQPDLSLRRC